MDWYWWILLIFLWIPVGVVLSSVCLKFYNFLKLTVESRGATLCFDQDHTSEANELDFWIFCGFFWPILLSFLLFWTIFRIVQLIVIISKNFAFPEEKSGNRI